MAWRLIPAASAPQGPASLARQPSPNQLPTRLWEQARAVNLNVPMALGCFIYPQVGCGDEAGLDGLGVAHAGPGILQLILEPARAPFLAQSISSALSPR